MRGVLLEETTDQLGSGFGTRGFGGGPAAGPLDLLVEADGLPGGALDTLGILGLAAGGAPGALVGTLRGSSFTFFSTKAWQASSIAAGSMDKGRVRTWHAFLDW